MELRQLQYVIQIAAGKKFFQSSRKAAYRPALTKPAAVQAGKRNRRAAVSTEYEFRRADPCRSRLRRKSTKNNRYGKSAQNRNG